MGYINTPPEWDAVGAEPSAELKEKGFTAGYKPAAAIFNWFWHTVSECLSEIQGHNPLRTYTNLSQLGLTAGTETIASIVAAMENNSQAIIAVDTNNNLSIYPHRYFGTLIVYKITASRTILFYGTSSTNTLYYGNYYYANNTEQWSGWLSYVQTNGGTITGTLGFQKTNNGSGAILKNHSNDADYGMYISDEDAEGKSVKLVVSAKNNRVTYIDPETKSYNIYGDHNNALLKEKIAHNQSLYTNLAQIGLTEGSETIETIASKLPTYSRLVITVGSANNLAIYPNKNFGLLIVEKTINSRIMFTFINNQASEWTAVYAIASSGNTWSDWKASINISNVINSLSSTSTTEALSAYQGKVLNDKIAALQKTLNEVNTALETLIG